MERKLERRKRIEGEGERKRERRGGGGREGIIVSKRERRE